MTVSSRRRRGVPVYAGMVAAVGFLLSLRFLEGPGFQGIDDANIFLVYARNLVEGHGFVFTPGLGPVEGVTSLLWTMVAIAATALPGPPEPYLLLISWVTTAAVVGLVWLLAETLIPAGSTRTEGSAAGASAAALLLVTPSLFAWTTLTLMDIGLWIALIALAALGLVADALGRPRGRLRGLWEALTVVALVLARPESLALVPGLIMVGAYTARGGERFRAAAVRTSVFVIAAMLLLAFRLYYFGYPFPNTYYAKVPPDMALRVQEGALYVARYFRHNPLLLFPAAAALVLVLQNAWGTLRGEQEGNGRERAVVALSMTILGIAAVVVLTGGDHFRGHRFLQPATPLLTVLSVVLAWRAIRWGGRMMLRSRLYGLAGLVALSLFVMAEWESFSDQYSIAIEFDLAQDGRSVGRLLSRPIEGELPTVGVMMAGGFGYGYEGPTLDLLGLNWPEMAHHPGERTGPRNHAAFWPEVFWRTTPDVMLPSLVVGGTGYPWCARFPRSVFGELLSSQRFQSAYQRVELEVTPDTAVQGWVRRDWDGWAGLRVTALPPLNCTG